MGFVKKKETQNFIVEYVDEIDAGNAAIFAGAGLSVGAGAVSWKELLRDSVSKRYCQPTFEQCRYIRPRLAY